MISSDLRGLIASMKAHVECDQMNKAFFAVFHARAQALIAEVEALENVTVPPHLRRAELKRTPQLELIQGMNR